MHDFVIRKLEDARAVWFAASKSFVLFEEPAFDVFRLYTGNPFSGSKPLKGFPEQERLNRIISFCEKKYGRIEENIPQFVKEIIRLINHFSNPENEITVSAKFPEVTDMTVLQVEEVVNYQIGFRK